MLGYWIRPGEIAALIERQAAWQSRLREDGQGFLKRVVSQDWPARLVIPITVQFKRLPLRVYHPKYRFDNALLQILVVDCQLIDLLVVAVGRVRITLRRIEVLSVRIEAGLANCIHLIFFDCRGVCMLLCNLLIRIEFFIAGAHRPVLLI